MELEHPRTDLDVYGSIISHISSAWSKYPNPSSFQDWVVWTLLSVNTKRTSIENVWPSYPGLSWSPLLPTIMEVHWAYSWTDCFVCSETSGSLWLGDFLSVRNLSACYLGGGVYPQHSTGALNLPVAFIVASSDILMNTAAVSHLVLSVPVRKG